MCALDRWFRRVSQDAGVGSVKADHARRGDSDLTTDPIVHTSRKYPTLNPNERTRPLPLLLGYLVGPSTISRAPAASATTTTTDLRLAIQGSWERRGL